MMTKLAQKRKEKGMTLKQIATVLAINASAVLQLERRGIKTATAARRYAEALKCKPEELIELKNLN